MTNDEDKSRLFWIIVLVSSISTGASTGINLLTPEARNDPFTGAEGKSLEVRIMRIENDHKEMKQDVRFITNEISNAIPECRIQMKHLKGEVDWLMKRAYK